jgi:hypothetical protein
LPSPRRVLAGVSWGWAMAPFSFVLGCALCVALQFAAQWRNPPAPGQAERPALLAIAALLLLALDAVALCVTCCVARRCFVYVSAGVALLTLGLAWSMPTAVPPYTPIVP